jgi:hypothetical protein
MKPSMMCRLTAIGLALLGTTGAIVACSSSTSNLGPPAQGTDAGADSKAPTKKDGGGAKPTDSGSDVQVADAPSSDAPSSPAPGLDAGGCVSDSAACNSCFGFPEGGDVQVSPNACSSAVGNCIQFTGSVPSGAP